MSVQFVLMIVYLVTLRHLITRQFSKICRLFLLTDNNKNIKATTTWILSYSEILVLAHIYIDRPNRQSSNWVMTLPNKIFKKMHFSCKLMIFLPQVNSRDNRKTRTWTIIFHEWTSSCSPFLFLSQLSPSICHSYNSFASFTRKQLVLIFFFFIPELSPSMYYS